MTVNDTRLADLMNNVREFGRLAAQGKDALPMLALKAAFAAADGVISLDKDADGNDDASRLYVEYQKAESKKAVHEHTAGGLKANTSKLRQIITAAVMPTCDFVDTLNKVVAKREEMLGQEGVKVRPAYAAYIEAARTQIQQPDDLTADQIEAAIKKPEAADKTVEGELKRADKILSDLISGDGGVKCDEPEIVQARELVAGKLAAFTLAKQVADATATLEAAGLQVVPAVADAA